MRKMKLNKKGFTLVELLAVLVILVVIMTIAIPSVASSIERSKNKQKNAKIELIESAAEIYLDRYRNSITSDTIDLESLICDRLLTKEQAKDPFDEKYTLSGYYSVVNNKWIEEPGNTNRLEIDAALNC